MRFLYRCLLLASLATLGFTTDHQLSRGYGTFASANFPTPYANNLDDTWTITVNRGFRVVLYFTHFDLEDSYLDAPCPLDYVQILDGSPSSNRTLGKFCGNNQYFREDAPVLYSQKIRSTSNKMTVRMVSDYSNDLPETDTPVGFRAHYYKEDINECMQLSQAAAVSDEPENVGQCDHFCNNYPGGYYCSCPPGYVLHPNNYTCSGDCSDVSLTDDRGQFASPGYPGNYPKLTLCQWTIKAHPGKKVQLTFNSFDVEQHSSGACYYDWMQIEDYSGVIGKYCGTDIPNNGEVMRSSTNWFKITFSTDKVTEKRGFSASYEALGIRCRIPDPPMHGRLAHPIRDLTVNPYVPFSSVIRYECGQGYRLIGSAKLVCLKDGSLSDYTPICEVF